jgi:rare lipoprotein A
MHAFTAAHPSLPFGTALTVRNPANGREVAVRVNDRGPHTGRRIIDLSRAAAHAIGLVTAGVGTVVLLRP